MTDCNGGGSNAIQIALKTERDGLEMYAKASERTAHPFGKKMFLSLADDEQSHIRMIEKVAGGLGMSAALAEARKGTPQERIKTIFSEARDELAERIAAQPDELQTLKIAMEFEKRGYEFYEKAAADASAKDEKSLFAELAKQETQHYHILQNTYDYLDDSGHWFSWEEQAVLDGG